MNTSNTQSIQWSRNKPVSSFANLALAAGFLLGLLLSSPLANAAELTSPMYEVYRGHVDSDGEEDLFLRSKRFIFISGKVSVSLTLSGPDSYVLFGQANGSFSAPVKDNTVDHKLLTRQISGVVFADFDGDDASDIVIQGESIGDQSVLLTGSSSDPAILQQFSMINGRDVSLESALISMMEIDGDGFADFEIAWTVGSPSTLINLGTGLFVFSGQSETTYIHTDFLGSTVAESDITGQITKRYYFRPYGAAIGTGSENEPAYTGHVFDGDLGLSYMQQRYYDPALGRFYSDDPVAFQLDQPHSFNRYAYAFNNPYTYIDPDGRFSIRGALGGALAKFASALAAAGSAIASGAADFANALGDALGDTIQAMASGEALPMGLLTTGKEGDEVEAGGTDNEGVGDNTEDWEQDYEDWASGNSEDTTIHGKGRDNRGVDKDTTRKNGEKFKDTDTGATVYVDGPDVVIDGERGNITSWGDQTEQETTRKVEDGIWVPVD